MGKSPQQWQTEAAVRAAEENLIVFAETGAGKTMVAELAIKDALLRQPSKRCAFLVTATRLLAHQQWQRIRQSLQEEYLAIETDEVVEVTGYTTSEWNESAWTNCFDRAKVLVGTIETFARAVIDHGYLQLEDFSLLVVDEAHKVVGDSPGAELLHRLRAASVDRAVPRCLGLTASYANDRATTWEDFLESRRSLQAIFQAKLHVCTVPERKKPCFEKIEYAPTRLASEAKSAAAVVCQYLWQELRKADLKEPKEAERLTQQLSELLTELGRDGFEVGLQEGLLAQIEGRIDNFSKIVEMKRLAERYKADWQQLKQSLQRATASVKNMDALRSFESRSEKLQALVQCLRGEFYEDPADLETPKVEDSCGMVFVSQVALALPLAALLDQALPGVAVGAVSGVSSMTEEQRNAAFSSFRLGCTRILVCTTCPEEGMDVAKCSFVVRFNQFNTTRSHVQGVGRARAEEARIYYFDNCPSAECHLAEVMKAVAWEPEEAPVTPPVPPYGRVTAVHPFRIPNSTAEVNLRSAPRILARYLSQTSGDSFKDLQFPGGLLLPGPHGGIKLMESDVCAFMASHDCDLKTSLKYVAVLALHRRGWLDRYNGVPRKVIAGAQAWQKSIGAAEEFECFDLTFMVSQSHRRLNSGRYERLGGSSMLEQVDLGRRRLKPEEIQNTQLTVNRSFSCGGSVMKAMALLVTGAKRIEDFPLIRVAWSESGQRWYSADNRRLFIFKVVAPLLDLEDVEVAVINWTSEFDCKNNQKERFGEVWATHATSVAQVRHQLLEAMARGDDFGPPESDDPELQSLYVPLLDPALSAPICAESEGEAEKEDLSSDAYHLPAEPSRNVRRLEGGDLDVLGDVRTLRMAGREARAEILQLQIEAFREQAEEHEKLKELLRPLNVTNFEQIGLNMSSCIAEAVRLSLIDDAEKKRLQAIDDRGNCAKHCPERLRATAEDGDAAPTREDDPNAPHGPSEAPVEVIHGEDAVELLRRVGQSLAKSPNRQEEVAVSLLKEVRECHCRLNDSQKLPLDFELLESQPEAFRMAVVVAGRRFEAAECCSTKKEAKRKAALAAIDGLVRDFQDPPSPRSSHGSSPDSERSSDWEVLEDYEICEAQGSEDYLRVELVLEPDHATSCQCFRPKEQLLEHLEQLMGRAPTTFECRFAFKGWQRFWRCRVQLQSPLLELRGSFEGTPAQTPEQAEQNAAWKVLEKLKLIKVVQLHKDQELQEALRTLPNSSNLELVQDGCVVSGDVRVSQLSSLRFEVRDAEPW